jgi:hypothetical protein
LYYRNPRILFKDLTWLTNAATKNVESFPIEEKGALLHTTVPKKEVLDTGEVTTTGGKKNPKLQTALNSVGDLTVDSDDNPFCPLSLFHLSRYCRPTCNG